MTDLISHPARGRLITPRRVAFLLMMLIPVAAVVHLLWGVLERRQLDKTIARLSAAGEPFTVAALNLETLPASQNASHDYRAASGLIDTKSDAWKVYYNAFDSNEFEVPFTPDESATARKILAENAQSFQLIAAARGKVAGGWGDNYKQLDFLSAGTMGLNEERALFNLLRLAAMTASVDKNNGELIDRLNDMLSFGDAAQQRPTLIAHLVAVGMTAAASVTTGTLAPNLSAGPDRERVTALIRRLLDESAMDQGSKLSWRSERMLAMTGLEDFASRMMTPPGNQPANGNGFLAYCMKPMMLDDQRLLAEQLQGVMTADTATDWPTAKSRMPTGAATAMAAHPYFHVLLHITLAGTDRASFVDYRAKSERRMAAVALAVRLYTLDNAGRFPATLAELVPTYLPTLPTDATTGKPILYKSDPPRIYCLGEDGIDYGGRPRDPEATDQLHRNHGDDVINLQIQPRRPAGKQTTNGF